MKIDLTDLPFIQRIALVYVYHKHKAHDARHSGGHQDPYVGIDDLKKKFRIDAVDREIQFEVLFHVYVNWLDRKNALRSL